MYVCITCMYVCMIQIQVCMYVMYVKLHVSCMYDTCMYKYICTCMNVHMYPAGRVRVPGKLYRYCTIDSKYLRNHFFCAHVLYRVQYPLNPVLNNTNNFSRKTNFYYLLLSNNFLRLCLPCMLP